MVSSSATSASFIQRPEFCYINLAKEFVGTHSRYFEFCKGWVIKQGNNVVSTGAVGMFFETDFFPKVSATSTAGYYRITTVPVYRRVKSFLCAVLQGWDCSGVENASSVIRNGMELRRVATLYM